MGDVANAIVEGEICCDCQRELGGEAPGHPRRCNSCARDFNRTKPKGPAQPAPIPRAYCPVRGCGKKVRAAGLADHMRDAHQLPPPEGWTPP